MPGNSVHLVLFLTLFQIYLTAITVQTLWQLLLRHTEPTPD